jgi:hypothetical protein
MAQVTLVWDDAALALLGRDDPQVIAAMDRLAAEAVQIMKRLCPVSPVFPVYADPIPLGSSFGPVYGGRGERHKGVRRRGGPDRPRYRRAGDFPLPPSGRLRSSIHAFRQPDGTIIIGPTESYAKYVNDGTVPHVIRSHGPWPLRSRVTGQVFGRTVHHPGTRGQHFIEHTAEALGGHATPGGA